jgi:hypothetical protein
MCTKALQAAWLFAAAAVLAGCPVVYRGYHAYDGRVVDARTGQGIADVRVVACLLDRWPGAHQTDCASARSKKEVLTDNQGAFEIAGSHCLGIALPVPEGMPGPYDTDLLFEKPGYQTKELHWWRDREVLAQQPLIVQLQPTRYPEGTWSPRSLNGDTERRAAASDD